MVDWVIRGGTVVTPKGLGNWDVIVAGEKIVGLGVPATLDVGSARVIDASGCIVMPGGIDPHVHTLWPDDSGHGRKWAPLAPPRDISWAALHGGTTTLIDFAFWGPDDTLEAAIEESERLWAEAYCDYSLHLILRGAVPPRVVDQLPEAIQAGFPSLKLFLSDIRPEHQGLMVGMGHAAAIVEQAAKHGGVLAIHAEDNDIVMYMYEKLQREGRTSYEHMPLVHNALSEDIAFRRVIRLARQVEGAALYMMHVTAATGGAAIREARAAGQPVYGEVLHNYSVFTEADYRKPDGVIYHTYPGLKSETDREALWAGVLDGTLSTMATDEASTARDIKTRGRTIFDATGGHSGVETRLAVTFTEGVVKRGLSLERFAAITSTNAAKILGLYPQKGAIAPGSDADIVIFDPRDRRRLQLAELHGSDYSIWDGYETAGWPRSTFLRGRLAVDVGKFMVNAPVAQRVARKVSDEIRTTVAV
jgi:dihydropyrimidinase